VPPSKLTPKQIEERRARIAALGLGHLLGDSDPALQAKSRPRKKITTRHYNPADRVKDATPLAELDANSDLLKTLAGDAPAAVDDSTNAPRPCRKCYRLALKEPGTDGWLCPHCGSRYVPKKR
jgi:hypothetical protein